MTNKENFEKDYRNPDKANREALGRWLCFEYYRDARGLQQVLGVHGFREIFEPLIQLDVTWGELLAGGFRYPTLRAVKRSDKVARLGRVVRPGQQSIDGIGEVRAREVLMYLAAADNFIKFLRGE